MVKICPETFVIMLQVINHQSETETKNLEAIKTMKKCAFLAQAIAVIVKFSYIYSIEN